MKLGYDLVVFDLEANQPSGKIIEIGAIKLTRYGELGGKFETLVNPEEPLTEYIMGLCPGIIQADVDVAPTLTEAMDKFYAWSIKESKNIVLCSWGNYDVAELRQQYKGQYPFRGKSMDAKSIAVWVSAMLDKKASSDGLENMMRDWGVEQIGVKHRALADAENTARLLQKMWKFYENKGMVIRDYLEELGIG